jgi:hypothetical protein
MGWNWGSILGDVLGGIGGFELGGPAGAAIGTELGGTLGGIATGEKVGKAALGALPFAGAAGLLGYGAESLGATPQVGSDLFGITGSSISGSSGDISNSTLSNPNFAAGNTSSIPAAGLSDPSSTSTLDSGGVTQNQLSPGTFQPSTTGGAGNTMTTGVPQNVLTPQAGNNDQPSGGILDQMRGWLGMGKNSNPVAPLVAGGGLLASMFANQSIPGMGSLGNIAANAQIQGNQLESYLQSGKLPPGAEQSVTQAVQSAKTAIQGKYAALGLSGSTMETQDLNNVDQQAASMKFQIANQLLGSGIEESKLASTIYDILTKTNISQNQITGNAIGNLASALNGGGQVNRNPNNNYG